MKSDSQIELLAARWSPECRALHAWLEARAIPHSVVEAGTGAAAEELRRVAGARVLPVLHVAGGWLLGPLPRAQGTRVRIECEGDRLLAGDLHLPPAVERPYAIVVLVHGFKGFKDWGFFPELARRLVRRQIAVLRFNMSGCGILADGDQFDDPEGFERNTLGQERKDLAVARRFAQSVVARLYPGGEIPLGLLGHSRGGGIALLHAADSPETRALVTWAAIASASRFGPEAERIWRAGGSVPVVNARTGQTFHLQADFLRDLEDHARDYDFPARARGIVQPWLLLHGEEDETVPVGEGEQLFRAAAGEAGDRRAELARIAGAGHTFGATHPLAHVPPALEIAIARSVSWFERHLRSLGPS